MFGGFTGIGTIQSQNKPTSRLNRKIKTKTLSNSTADTLVMQHKVNYL